MSHESTQPPAQTESAQTGANKLEAARKIAKVTLKGAASLTAVAAMVGAVLGASQLRESSAVPTPYRPQVQLQSVTYPFVCMPVFASDEGALAGSTMLRLEKGAALAKTEELTASGPKAVVSKLTDADTAGVRTLALTGHKTPVAFTLQTSEQTQVQGTTGIVADTDTVNGSSVSPCELTTTQAWFSGASTAVENSSFLLVANPAATAVDISIQGWGASGPLDNVAHVTVPAGAYRAVNLATYFPDEERLTIHATSTGGTAAFAMDVNATKGLSAKGFARLNPEPAPTRRLVLPSVDGTAKEASLRLSNPGGEPAKVSVKVITDAGLVDLAGADEMTVDEGGVFELSLAGMPSGNGGLVVEATAPILASASGRYPAATKDQPERASLSVWEPAVAITQGSSVVPNLGSAKVTSRKLVVINPQDEPAQVTVGKKDYALAPGTSKRIDVSGDFVSFTATRPVVASLELAIERGGNKEHLALGLQSADASIPITTFNTLR